MKSPERLHTMLHGARAFEGQSLNWSVNTDTQQQEAASRLLLRAGYLQR